jgi:hypothetical protein
MSISPVGGYGDLYSPYAGGLANRASQTKEIAGKGFERCKT